MRLSIHHFITANNLTGADKANKEILLVIDNRWTNELIMKTNQFLVHNYVLIQRRPKWCKMQTNSGRLVSRWRTRKNIVEIKTSCTLFPRVHRIETNRTRCYHVNNITEHVARLAIHSYKWITSLSMLRVSVNTNSHVNFTVVIFRINS